MKFNDKIYVAGHNGLVGSAIVRCLQKEGYKYIITASSAEVDLRDTNATKKFFLKEKPQFVFMAAAKVGGILANSTKQGEFIYDNLCIQNNVIHESYKNGVEKLMFLGSSCIYPKHCPQPIKEEYLLTGTLEPTNASYAIAKIAGIEMCKAYNNQYGCNFISVMPTNLYGPGDNYDLQNAHVLPALIRKFYEAQINNAASVEVWGSGKPRREFLHVDDMAEACYFLMKKEINKNEIINIGMGVDHTIKEMAETIKKITKFKGSIKYDKSMPDGTMQKLLDTQKINDLGWKYKIDLQKGLESTVADFEKNYTKYVSTKIAVSVAANV